MAKKRMKVKVDRKKSYDITQFVKKNAMRYILTVAICTPLIMFINYFLSQNVSGYNSLITILVTITLLLFALFLATIICLKKDKQEQEKTDAEKRDPFAD